MGVPAHSPLAVTRFARRPEKAPHEPLQRAADRFQFHRETVRATGSRNRRRASARAVCGERTASAVGWSMGPGTMKIAQICPLYESCPPKLYGGTERIVFYLTEELVTLGHEVTL